MKPIRHLILAGLLCTPAHGAAVFYEELPYFSAADSPFYAGIQSGAIYLEDFEDHQLNTPHITSWDWPRVVGIVNDIEIPSYQQGRSHRLLGNVITTFSVDADDGLNGDFRGLLGDTWTTLDVVTGQIYGRMEFRFSPDDVGRYPTYVGFVVTEALDPFSEVEFGTSTFTGPESPEGGYDPLTWEPDITFPGDTRQHRFFGIHVPSGIWRLNIDNVRQIDHLQYGYAIPEPGAGVLGVLVAFSLFRRRARQYGRRLSRPGDTRNTGAEALTPPRGDHRCPGGIGMVTDSSVNSPRRIRVSKRTGRRGDGIHGARGGSPVALESLPTPAGDCRGRRGIGEALPNGRG